MSFKDVKVPLWNQNGFDGQGFQMRTEIMTKKKKKKKTEANLVSSVQILAALRKAIGKVA